MNIAPTHLRHPFCWTALTVLILFALFSPSTAWADSPLEGTKPAHARVTWTSDPARSATISWSTAKPANQYLVRYRVRGATEKESTVAGEKGQFTGGEVKLYYYHARLSELTPSTEYEFQIVSDDETSPRFYFLTAPDVDRPLSILHGGDSRSNQAERRRVNQMLAQMVSESFENSRPSDDIFALAHGGDYIVNGRDLKQWSTWLSDHELTTGADGRMLPVIPARGNHDRSELFNQVFGFPEGDLNYFAMNVGPQVRFVTLNTETSTAGEQAKWLEGELRNARPNNRWVLAQYHRPAYPAVKKPSAALKSWVPLFEKYDVDLVCEADGHNIKRTVPIRGNEQDETGIVYIGEGGLGVGQRTPKSERWYLQPPGMSDTASHVFVLTFETDQLKGTCVRLDGTIADRFTRNPRRIEGLKAAR
jgi:hypothetical protein